MIYFTVAQLKTFVAGIAAVHNNRLIGFPDDPLAIIESRIVDGRGNETVLIRAYFDPKTRTIISVP